MTQVGHSGPTTCQAIKRSPELLRARNGGRTPGAGQTQLIDPMVRKPIAQDRSTTSVENLSARVTGQKMTPAR